MNSFMKEAAEFDRARSNFVVIEKNNVRVTRILRWIRGSDVFFLSEFCPSHNHVGGQFTVEELFVDDVVVTLQRFVGLAILLHLFASGPPRLRAFEQGIYGTKIAQRFLARLSMKGGTIMIPYFG
jgi:hypothetical protein